jgi:UDP-GlcNAc3NAcA epimerase
MKIITIIGARPQFIKATVVSRAIIAMAKGGVEIEEKILHTGQHYDSNMSELFFRQLDIPTPCWNLACGNNFEQMKASILPILQAEKPDIVLVYGDTTSTLAGAQAAHSLSIPIAHIEAGLRSFNMSMPEEYNRIQTDRLSTWLFCPTHTAVENLHREGITTNVFHTGDVMYDAALTFIPDHQTQADILSHYAVRSKQFAIATIHRAATAENVPALRDIIQAFKQIELPILLHLHPHTAKTIEADSSLQDLIISAPNVHIIAPIGYIEMLVLERHASHIFTDSGGMQKEAYFQGTPCITLRDETEWTETVNAGWNRLVGTNTQRIIDAFRIPFAGEIFDEYGNGNSAQQIIHLLCQKKY